MGDCVRDGCLIIVLEAGGLVNRLGPCLAVVEGLFNHEEGQDEQGGAEGKLDVKE